MALVSGCEGRAPARQAIEPATEEPREVESQLVQPASEVAPALDVPAKSETDVPRLVAVGDLHGDLGATRAVLKVSGLIDAQDRWIGGKAVFVQTGDQLDRGDDERAILELLVRLTSEAEAVGGRLVILNGNHETMNVQGDYRYVTAGGLTDFENVPEPSIRAGQAPQLLRSRAEAFLPGGTYATLLAKRDLIAVVGDSVFVHGGVLPEHVEYGIARLNLETREWMEGKRGMPAPLASARGPVWVRDYSEETVGPDACSQLSTVLKALGVKRMVVGHTVQSSGITSACDEQVYRIDVGLAAYYGDRPVEALEIDDGTVKVLGRTVPPSASTP